MRSEFHWTAVLSRLFGGMIVGAFWGSFLSCMIAIASDLIARASDRPQPAFGPDGLTLIAIGILSLPSAAVAGACGGIWKRNLIGFLGGLAGGLCTVVYLGVLLWRYNDPVPWLSFLLVFGVPLTFGAALAGVVAVWMHSKPPFELAEWEQTDVH